MRSRIASRGVLVSDWFDRLGGVTHIDGSLYRSPVPMLPRHVREIRAAGIRCVFSLEECVPGDLVRRAGLDWRPHFWTDDAPPSPGQARAFLDDLASVDEDVPVLVHCKAGWGRAGTALTLALMARRDWSADRALAHQWARVPAAERIMRANGQAEFVRGFAAATAGRGLYGAAPDDGSG